MIFPEGLGDGFFLVNQPFILRVGRGGGFTIIGSFLKKGCELLKVWKGVTLTIYLLVWRGVTKRLKYFPVFCVET